MIDVAELRDLTVDDLHARVKDLEDQLFRMRQIPSLDCEISPSASLI